MSLSADCRRWSAAVATATREAGDADLLVSLGRLYAAAQGRALMQTLLARVEWQSEYIAFGRRFQVPRVQAWYADPDTPYRYTNNFLGRHDWIAPLSAVRRDVERASGHRFNAVLLTWYRDGHDHVTWHADDDAELGEAPVIASLSLGATRTFQYRRRNGDDSGSLPLHDGELLLMRPRFQRHWLHQVPVETGITAARINLTFRHITRPAQD